MAILGAVLFSLFAFAGVVLLFFGIPGTFLILAGAIVYGALTGFLEIDLAILLVLLGLALAGEGIEFLSGLAGVPRISQ